MVVKKINAGNIIIISKIIIFMGILFIGFTKLNIVFMPKTYTHSNSLNSAQSAYYEPVRIRGFYGLDKNSCDVIYLGSSQTHCSINPNVIFDTYGITGYNFSADGQSFMWSKYYLEEAFRYQAPELVVLDIGYLTINLPSDPIQWQHWSSDFLENSKEKVKFISTNYNYKDSLELLLPIYRYHSRWKSLKYLDWLYENGESTDLFNGYFAYTNDNLTNTVKEDISMDPNEAYEVNNQQFEYIKSIKEFCDLKGVPILFIKTPIIKNNKDQLAIDQFSLYCDANDWEFMDFTEPNNLFNLDKVTDYSDTFHLNYRGAEKFSKYLGGIIEKKYSFNKKSSKTLETWQKSSEYVRTLIEKYEKGTKN